MKIKYLLHLLCCLLIATAACRAQYTALHNFNDTAGEQPYGSLTLASNKLFGMTSGGLGPVDGVLFSIDTTGANYTVLVNFSDTNGPFPEGSLTLVGNKLFGTNFYNNGILFSIDTNGTGYKIVRHFNDTTGQPDDPDLIFGNGKLYGTVEGGFYLYGGIYCIDTNGTNFKIIYSFTDTTGVYHYSKLTLVGSKLFGTTSLNNGTIYSVDTNGADFKTILKADRFPLFAPPYPIGGPLTYLNHKLYGVTSNNVLANGGVIFSLDTNGANYKEIFTFNGTNGQEPVGGLQATANGKLLGMASQGGLNNQGVVFSLDTDGTNCVVLHSFSFPTGDMPIGSVTPVNDKLYGMTLAGGTDSLGVIFMIGNYSTMGTNDIKINNTQLVIYPNPNNGVFNLIMPDERQTGSEVEIYNTLGEKIYSQQFSTFHSQLSINISAQPDGVYLCRVLNKSTKEVTTCKFIINR